MTLTQSEKNQIEQLENDNFTHIIDLTYHIENSNAQDIEELTDFLIEQGAFDIEIIYYHNAIDYLKEHDPSLRESFEYMHDLGFTFDSNNLSSETLASVHASEQARETWYEVQSEVEAILFDN